MYLYRDSFLAQEQPKHWSEMGGRRVIRRVRALSSLVSIRQRCLVRCAGLGSCPCGGGLSLDVEARAACSRKHPRTGQRQHQALWSSSQPATLHNALERAETPVSLNLDPHCSSLGGEKPSRYPGFGSCRTHRTSRQGPRLGPRQDNTVSAVYTLFDSHTHHLHLSVFMPRHCLLPCHHSDILTLKFVDFSLRPDRNGADYAAI